jgi:hypothetical protein
MTSLSEITPRARSESSPTTTSRATWRSLINWAASASDAEPWMVTAGWVITSRADKDLQSRSEPEDARRPIGLANDADEAPRRIDDGQPADVVVRQHFRDLGDGELCGDDDRVTGHQIYDQRFELALNGHFTLRVRDRGAGARDS